MNELTQMDNIGSGDNNTNKQEMTLPEMAAVDASISAQDAVDKLQRGEIAQSEASRVLVAAQHILEKVQPSNDAFFNAQVDEMRTSITDWLKNLVTIENINKAA